MPRVIPPSGMKEISVTSPSGQQKVYKADKSGLINVSESVAKQLKREGLVGIASAGMTTQVRDGKCCKTYTIRQACKECQIQTVVCGTCREVLSPCNCEEEENG